MSPCLMMLPTVAYKSCHTIFVNGPGSSYDKALGYGLDGPGSILGLGGGVEIFLHSYMSRLDLGYTQPSTK